MAIIIKDNILYSSQDAPKTDGLVERSFVHRMFDYIREDLEANLDREWLIDIDEYESKRKRLTRFSDVIPASMKAASALKKFNIKKGDVVQIILPNNCHYYFPVFAAWLIGAKVSVSDPGLPGEIMIDQLEETQGKVIFCLPETVEKLLTHTGLPIVVIPDGETEALPEISNVHRWEDFLGQGDDNEPGLGDDAATALEEVMIIFWSSGTTGRPKGIEHTQRFLVNNLQKSKFEPGTLIQTTCFYHTGGFFLPLDGGLFNRFRNPFLNPNRGIKPEAILKGCHEYQPCVLIVGAHHALQIGNYPVNNEWKLDSVLGVAPMGSAVHTGLPSELKRHFPNLRTGIFGFYGMSEVGTISHQNSPDNLGYLGQGCKVKIVNPSTSDLCGPNEVGEILAWTPSIMKGYLNRPEENDNFFCDDGFIRTGDLGYYDEKGILYYHDRLKALVKYNNIHIYPIAIEDVFHKHPEVLEAGVFGRPDPVCQELLTAVVIKREGSTVSEDELIEFVNSKVDEYKKIRGGVKFVTAIPRNPQGKILKAKLGHLFDD